MLGKWPLGKIPFGALPAPQGGQQHQISIVAGVSAAASVATPIIRAVLILASVVAETTMSRPVGKMIHATVPVAVSVTKHIARTISVGVKAITEVIAAKTVHVLIDMGVSVAGTVNKSVLKPIVAGVRAAIGHFSRVVGKIIEAGVPAATAIAKAVSASIVIAVRVIGTVVTPRILIVVVEAVVGVSASIVTIARRILFRLGRFLGLGDSVTRQHPQRGQITREGRGIGRDDELFD